MTIRLGHRHFRSITCPTMERSTIAPALALAMLVAAPAAPGASPGGSGLSEFQACPPQYRVPAPLAMRARCATLTVPENRAAPGGRTLELPVLKYSAAGARPGAPVFVLNGGPGEPNLATIRPFVQIGQEHDIVWVGYRGAEGSSTLQCPEVSALVDVPEILSTANLRELSSAASTCARRLKRSGAELSRYGILDVIDDLEAARGALGYEVIDLLSSSYGTRVAQYYARRHPQRIFRSVMLGVNPPGHFVFSAQVNDRTLARLSQLCSADASCSAQTSDLRRTVLNALQIHGQRGDTRVDAGKTQLALFYSMYRRDSFRAFLEAAIAAGNGDWSGLAALGHAAGESMETAIWGDLLSKGALDSYRYAALEPTFSATSESMGSPFDLLLQNIGRRWPQPPVPAQYHRAASDPTQTLLINGDLDVATPLTFAESELLPHLPNGKLLVLKDYGHGDIARQGAALDQIVATYLATGELDATPLKEDRYAFW